MLSFILIIYLNLIIRLIQRFNFFIFLNKNLFKNKRKLFENKKKIMRKLNYLTRKYYFVILFNIKIHKFVQKIFLTYDLTTRFVFKFRKKNYTKSKSKSFKSTLLNSLYINCLQQKSIQINIVLIY